MYNLYSVIYSAAKRVTPVNQRLKQSAYFIFLSCLSLTHREMSRKAHGNLMQ